MKGIGSLVNHAAGVSMGAGLTPSQQMTQGRFIATQSLKGVEKAITELDDEIRRSKLNPPMITDMVGRQRPMPGFVKWFDQNLNPTLITVEEAEKMLEDRAGSVRC